MTDYPKDAATRRELREKHFMQRVHGALRVGVSIRCGKGDHARPNGQGCLNDGSSCLCWCHDQEVTDGPSS